MESPQIIWDLEDELDGNVQHCLEHDVTIDEVEEVLQAKDASESQPSRSSNNRISFGYTSTGRHLAVVWERVQENPLIIRPVTAFDAPEPKKPKRKGKRR